MIEEVIEESPTIKTFVIRPKERLEFKAGQFIALTVPGLGESPFTPSSSPYREEEIIDVTIMRAGRNTSALHNMKPGAEVGIRGPFGTPYPLGDFEGKEVYVVGGGVGFAPLRSLLFAFLHDFKRYKRIYLRYGSRSPVDRIYKGLLQEWEGDNRIDLVQTVDVGDETWSGNVGVVTTILKKEDIQDYQNSVVISCGPPVMIRFATRSLLEMGFTPENIYLSMERNMSCGIGKCGHCRLGNYYVCKDGPVFRYDKIKDIPDLFE